MDDALADAHDPDLCVVCTRPDARLAEEAPGVLAMHIAATDRALEVYSRVREQEAELDPDTLTVAGAPGVLWMAMRYALGRATYAVFEVGSAIRAHRNLIPPAARERMAGEIDRAIAEGRAGWACDVDEWTRTAAALRAAS